MEVFIFSRLSAVRFTESGALSLAIQNGYKDLQDSYDNEFHYFTEMEAEDLDDFLSF